MSITVACTCGKKFSAREEHLGKRGKCSNCGEMFLIAPPSPPVDVAAAAAPLYDGHRVTHWLDLLASSDPAERRAAADVLAGVGPEAVVELPAFVGRCSAENMLVRLWATVCLGQMGAAANEAVPALLERLNDEQPLLRDKAVRAIEQVVPGAEPFVPHLLRGLNANDDERRAAAIKLFRRDLLTAGVSRFRFWACVCGRVYIKLDLDQLLRKLVDAPDEVHWDGQRTCGQCGAQYEDRRVFAGEFDVPEPHWAKLRNKFGPHLSIPDDFLAEAQPDAGYRIRGETRGDDPLPGGPSLSPFSVSWDAPVSLESDQGYAIAQAPPAPAQGGVGSRPGAEPSHDLTPGARVPLSGSYKCLTCGKRRLSGAADAHKSPAREAVVMQFKAGTTFSECPHCGELTEWQGCNR